MTDDTGSRLSRLQAKLNRNSGYLWRAGLLYAFIAVVYFGGTIFAASLLGAAFVSGNVHNVAKALAFDALIGVTGLVVAFSLSAMDRSLMESHAA